MPLHEPPPYEVLGVAPTAGVRDINVAVGPAMKAGRFPRRQIQEAAALLRNPDRRLELDLQRPMPPDDSVDVLDLLAPVLDEPLASFEGRQVPSAAELLTMRRADFTAGFEELPPIDDASLPPVPARFAVSLSVLPAIEFV